MDHKKKTKTREISSILNEKECKYVSLKAITNVTIKEQNDKHLKELVEEINLHLIDLRTLNIDNDTKAEEKRMELIKLFEKCLVKIVTPSGSTEIWEKLKRQHEDIIKQFHIAEQEKNVTELEKLASRVARNLSVLKNFPEVKLGEGSDKLMEFIQEYERLYEEIRCHFIAENISNPMPTEEYRRSFDVFNQGKKKDASLVKHFSLKEMSEKNKNAQDDLSQTETPVQLFGGGNLFKRPNKNSEDLGLAAGKSIQNDTATDRYVGMGKISIEKTDHIAEKQLNDNKEISKLLEKPTALKESNSFKSSPGLKKIFNSCMPTSAMEETTPEFKSPFEQHIKTFQLKSTGFSHRLNQFKQKEESSDPIYENVKPFTPTPDRKQAFKQIQNQYENVDIKPKPKPLIIARKNVLSRKDNVDKESRKSDPLNISRELQASPTKERHSTEDIPPKNTTPTIPQLVLHDEPITQPLDHMSVTIRDRATAVPLEAPRQTFSTFRASSDSIKSETEDIRKVISKPITPPPKTPDPPKQTFQIIMLDSLIDGVIEVENEIKRFKGFKTDEGYLKIDNKLAKLIVESCDIQSESSESNTWSKEMVLFRLRKAEDDLDSRIEKNQIMLQDVLEDMVRIIAGNHGIKQRS